MGQYSCGVLPTFWNQLDPRQSEGGMMRLPTQVIRHHYRQHNDLEQEGCGARVIDSVKPTGNPESECHFSMV